MPSIVENDIYKRITVQMHTLSYPPRFYRDLMSPECQYDSFSVYLGKCKACGEEKHVVAVQDVIGSGLMVGDGYHRIDDWRNSHECDIIEGEGVVNEAESGTD